MKIGIPTETRPGEMRVAATPEIVKKLSAKHQVIVQAGAGLSASIADDAYAAAGATIGSAAEAFDCEVVLKVRAPDAEERNRLKRGTVLLGMLDRFGARTLTTLAAAGVQAFSLAAVPRLTPAQSIDVLSSFANLATYKAVMLAAHLPPLRATADESHVRRKSPARADRGHRLGQRGFVPSGVAA